MSYLAIKRCGATLNGYMLNERCHSENLLTVWFQFHYTLKTALPWKQQKDQWLPGFRREGGMIQCTEHLGLWNCSDWDHMWQRWTHVIMPLSKPHRMDNTRVNSDVNQWASGDYDVSASVHQLYKCTTLVGMVIVGEAVHVLRYMGNSVPFQFCCDPKIILKNKFF